MDAQHYLMVLCWIVLLKRQVECGKEQQENPKKGKKGAAKGSEKSPASSSIAVQRNEEPSEGDQSLDRVVLRATAASNAENYAEAIAEYSKAIERRPLSSQYYALRARCYWKIGNLAEAERDYRQTIFISPHPSLYVLLGTVLFQAGKYEEAIKETIISNNENEIEKLGDGFYILAKYEQAYECYCEAIKINSKNITYYRKRANCSNHAQNFGSAVSDYREILKMNPASKGDRKALVSALFLSGQFKEAIRETFQTDAHTIEDLGTKLLHRGKISQAVFCYDQAIKREPNNIYFYMKRGKAHMLDQKMDKAIQDFTVVLSSLSHYTNCRKLLITALLEVNEIEKATAEMQYLNDDELYFLAYELFILGKFEKAVLCCTEVIAKKSTDKGKYLRLRGNCHKRLGDYKSAIKDFETIVKINPQSTADFLIELSQLLIDNLKYSEAKAVLENMSKQNLTEDEATSVQMMLHKLEDVKEGQPETAPIDAATRDFGPSEVPSSSTYGISDEGRILTPESVGQLLDVAVAGPSSGPLSINDTVLGKKRKDRNETFSNELQLALRNMMGGQSREMIQDEQSDKFDAMARMWTYDLKSVPDPEQVLFAKKAIGDVLFEAQMGNLRKNSVTIKPASSESNDLEKDSQGATKTKQK